MWWLTDISIFPYIWLQLLRGHHSIEVLLNHIMIECLTTNTGESLMSINAQYICHSECSMLRTHNMSHHIAYLSIPITGGATSFPIYWTHLSPPCNIWKWHLICWLYYSMKYSCRIVVGTHSAHSVTLLNCEKLEYRVCGHLLFGMGSMQSLISTRRLHRSCRPTEFNIRLDFRLHHRMQTIVKRKRWNNQDVNQIQPTIRWSPKNFD